MYEDEFEETLAADEADTLRGSRWTGFRKRYTSRARKSTGWSKTKKRGGRTTVRKTHAPYRPPPVVKPVTPVVPAPVVKPVTPVVPAPVVKPEDVPKPDCPPGTVLHYGVLSRRPGSPSGWRCRPIRGWKQRRTMLVRRLREIARKTTQLERQIPRIELSLAEMKHSSEEITRELKEMTAQ